LLFYVAVPATYSGSYQASIGQTNTREHMYEFTVTLESATYAFECIRDVAALNIVHVCNFLLVKC